MVKVTLTVLVIVIVVSLLVAVIIKGLTALLGRQRGGSNPVAPAAAPAPAAVRATPHTAGGHTPEHIAAITAAVAAVFDEAAVIVHIEPARGGSGWTHESRAAHHTSHNLGRGSR